MIRLKIDVLQLKLFLCPIMLISSSVFAEACPGDKVPDQIQALYVKYEITDELSIRRNRESGAPASVVGDEIKESIHWNHYRWKRRYGKTWEAQDTNNRQRMDIYLKRMEAIMEQERQGGPPQDELADRLTEEMMTYEPLKTIKEYDWIDVEAPEYSLYYNKASHYGYGSYGDSPVPLRQKVDKHRQQQLDSWVASSFKDANKIFGFNRTATKKSKILGYEVVCEVVQTSFKDFQREYKQIELCIANIDGYEIDLYRKTGQPDQQYIMKAVVVDRAYPVAKELFCAPDYVRMRRY